MGQREGERASDYRAAASEGAAAEEEEEEEAVRVRPQRGAPPPFPHSPQLSSSSPGRGGGT